MYKDLLQSIEGIEVYPIISLFIFLALFLCIVWWILKLDKGYVKEMEKLPLINEEYRESFKKEISKNLQIDK